MSKVEFNLEEKLKYFLVPPKLYIKYKVIKEYLYGESEFGLLKYLVDADKNSIDIGANKGVYTKALSKLSKKVFAFEPNPKMYSILKRSVPDNAETFSYALSNESKVDSLIIPKGRKGLSNQGSTLSRKKLNEGQRYVEVEVHCKCLDDLNLTEIGFIKIDVEGFEKEVIEGGKNTILRDKPTLLVEIEERYTKTPIKESIKWIENLGYEGFALFNGRLLKNLDYFDSEEHHNAVPENNPKQYVNNFIFLSRKV